MTSRAVSNICLSNLFRDPAKIWQSMPYQQWDAIHNKLRLIQAQGLECAPVGQLLVPTRFPVILKPIISMAAARQKYRVCVNVTDYQKLVESGQFAGWFWMPYLDNEQQSCLELIIHNGRPVFGYSLDYTTNPDMSGALSHISLNTYWHGHGTMATSNIPGWEQVLAPAFKDYTGAISIYYMGQYIISAAARWTIWSEYIWQSPQLQPVLDRICKLLNTYSQQASSDASLDLLRRATGGHMISLVPIYLKSVSDLPLARKHWETISNSLGVSIHWQPCEPREDEFMPLVATTVASSVEQLKKINKYKQISQLAAPEQSIPIVY